MKAATLALLLGATLLVVGLACGDDEAEPPLTLGEYFVQFEEVIQRGCSGIEAVRNDTLLTPTFENLSDEERIGRTRIVFESALAVSLSVVAELSELRPPNDVQHAHSAYIDALVKQGNLTEAFLKSDRFQDWAIAMANAESLEDYQDAAELGVGVEIRAAEESQEEAGRELGSVAAENGSEFDTSCELTSVIP